jgi:hypothetical protein
MRHREVFEAFRRSQSAIGASAAHEPTRRKFTQIQNSEFDSDGKSVDLG